jgi:hypothetical protein
MSGRGWLQGAAGLVALACMMTPNQQREDTLIREARTFNDDLRWARYEQLSASLPRDEAPLFLARANAIGDDLVMADFEVTSINFGPGSDTATVGVSLQWYNRRASIVRSTTIEQRWEMRSGRWLMTRQRRVRGDRFPLVLEPVTPPAPPATPVTPAPPPSP